MIRHSSKRCMKRFALASRLQRFLSCVILVFALGSPAATLVVTNQANTGPGTLRTLLPTARNGDVITFAVTGFITNISSGGFVISNNVNIVGPGPDLLTITGTNRNAGFVVNSGVTSILSGLTFTQCYRAVFNSGSLTVSNCGFTGNLASGGSITFINGSSGGSGNGGSAIYNIGVLTTVNCQFSNNKAGGCGWGCPIPQYEIYGPGAYTTGGNGGIGGNGGAIYDVGTAAFRTAPLAGITPGMAVGADTAKAARVVTPAAATAQIPGQALPAAAVVTVATAEPCSPPPARSL